LFHSAFTRLLVIIVAAGMAITLTVIAGFSIIRFHSVNYYDRNLSLYLEYLKTDLGDPPELSQAEAIARRTGLSIRFDHSDGGWQTARFPTRLTLKRAWVRTGHAGLWIGQTRGHEFVRSDHAGGSLIFVSPRRAVDHENAGIAMLAIAILLVAILSTAYFLIRRVLRPLRSLKAGVEALGSGRLDHRVPSTGSEEFRDLSDAFNTMAGRISSLLANKDRLLVDVSHELRSPLTRIKVQVEMIQDEEFRQGIRADVAEMEAMVNTILEDARLRSTAAELDLKPLDMAEMLRAVAGEFQASPPGAVGGALAPATVQADGEKIRTVFRNLIENAIKHSPDDGPPVKVSMIAGETVVEVTVKDKGAGIAEADLPHLFEPFYRTDASRSRKTGGYGLGLSICKAVVDAHGGSIRISSIPGKGTAVTVVLPMSPDA
jgi:signal transduction histidine kinase